MDGKAHFVFPVNLSTLLKEVLWNWVEYLLHRWYPPKPFWLRHSRVPLLFLLSLHLGFPVIIPLWSQFALSAGNLLKLCVCLCIKCVLACVCMCGKSAKVAGKGEATECTTALTWWQMKIKRLLLKMGGVCFQMGLCGHVQDEERAMARKEGWAVRRRGRASRHRAGLWEQDGGGFIFLAA